VFGCWHCWSEEAMFVSRLSALRAGQVDTDRNDNVVKGSREKETYVSITSTRLCTIPSTSLSSTLRSQQISIYERNDTHSVTES
jgi:hypothetical protein